MLMKSIKIITLIVIFCIGLSLVSSTPTNLAKNQEEIWNFYNNQLNGGAVYQIYVDEISQDWYCSVNKTSLYTKKRGNEYWDKITLPQTNTYIQYIFPFSSFFLMMADQGMYLYHGQYQEESLWESLEAPKAIKTIEIMKTAFLNTEIYWLATSSGLYFSYNPGTEKADQVFLWHLSSLNTGIEIKDLWFDKDSHIFYVLSADGWLYRATDPNFVADTKWDRIRLDAQIHNVQQFMTAQDQDKTWIVSTQTQGLFVSKNYGLSWENISKELPNLYISQMVLIQGDVVAATYGGLYRYQFDQKKWNKIGDEILNEQINCFAVDEMNQEIFIGTNGNGVWRIDTQHEQPNWQKNDQKIEGVLVKKLIKNHQENKMLLSTWGAGVFLSNNHGINWKQVNQGLTNPYILSLFYESDEKIWAGTLNGGLFLSRNFGESWNQIKSTTLLSKYIYSILVDRTNSNVIYVGTNRTVFKSNNQGESWNTLDLGTEDHPVGNILTLEQDLKNPDVIYAGTDSSGVYVSKDAGQTWFAAQNGLPFKTINQLVSIPHKTNLLIAATNGDGCYMTTNQGNAWIKMEGPQKDAIVYDVLYTYDKNDLDACYISTESSLYQLNFLTNAWKIVGKNLTHTSVRTSMYYQNQLWVGTYGKGVAKLINLPTPPIPMEPANYAEVTKTRIMFRWSESSYSEHPVLYKVQIATDKDFKEIVMLSNTISGDQWLVPENVLKKHQTYYWRVRGETILGVTDWSKSYQFTVITIIQMQINQSEIQINGQNQPLDPNPKVVPVIQNNRTFLPIRIMIEAWEGTIQWDNPTKKVMITLHDISIQLIIQQPTALVNGVTTKIDENQKVVPFILNGRTMLPLRFISENLQAQVEWDSTTQRITITYPSRRTL